MKCEKCKNERMRIISVVDTPILDKEKNTKATLTIFTIKCLNCEHEFKIEYIDC